MEIFAREQRRNVQGFGVEPSYGYGNYYKTDSGLAGHRPLSP